MTPGTERFAEAFVQNALAGTRLARARWVTETGSTNDDLAVAAATGADEQVLITDLQTAGRGRRNRVWEAPPRSGVLMSVLLRDVEPGDGFWAVAAISLAACETIDELITAPCTVKWPNDVMVGANDDQRKVAGILAQVVDGGIVVGIGINANWPAEVPSDMAERGTAVNRHLVSGAEVDRPALAAGVLQRAIGHLASDTEVLRSAWQDRSSTMGRLVRVERETGDTVGIAAKLGADGSLQIRNDQGVSWHSVGDVVHLRAVD